MLNRYRGETTALLGNAAAATQAFNVSPQGFENRKYIRTTSPFNPEALASLPARYTGNRTNTYVKAGKYTELSKALSSFLTDQCSSGLSGIELTEGAPGDLPAGFFTNTQDFAYGGAPNTNSDNIPAPRCDLQGTSESIGGPPSQATNYPHIRADSP